MVATGAGSRVDVTLKLPQLQNFCKRDPAGYKEEYEAQIRRLESELGLLALRPADAPSKGRLVELIQFAAAVSSSSYKGQESDRIVKLLMNLLLGLSFEPMMASSGDTTASTSTPSSNTTVINVSSLPLAAIQLHRDIRKACVSALILMRNKGVVEPLTLLELFFRLMAVIPDKGLREQLYKHMVNDIRNLNKNKRPETVNRSIQIFLHRIVSSSSSSTNSTLQQESSASCANKEEASATEIAAKRATDMVCELYRRRVWTDDRVVAILASAVQSSLTTVARRAMRFFLGIEETMARDEAERQEDDWENKNRIDYHSHSKKTAARQRHTVRQLKNRKKHQQKREGATDWMEALPDDDAGLEVCKKLYPAIELLRDPQGLAEFVLKRLRSTGKYNYETKLLMMNFCTRLVGNHELMLLPLYPFLQKYMGGHQKDVTLVLTYTVQACHHYVPPDEVYGILKTIAHNFVTERCSEEQMAVGINACRAICARVPAILSVEESRHSTGSTCMDIEAFARDLAAYSNHRDRSVATAGKTWTNFIRESNPGLLAGKDRGPQGSALYKSGVKPLRYGQQHVASGVEGADLLAVYEAKRRLKKQARENESDEEESGGSDDEEEEEVEDDSDGEAPTLVRVDDPESQSKEEVPDIAKMSAEEREQLKQKVSQSRVFSATDFEKMRKLVEREQRTHRDPREAARIKRMIARGEDHERLSGDESDDGSESEDEAVRVAGAVNPTDIMALAKRKRQTKAQKLEKIIAGRSAFESKDRVGGSTNVEKKRKKNFLMTKFSSDARSKGKGKGGLSKRKKKVMLGHAAKKRRRKS